MSEKQFSFVGDSLNESLIKSLKAGKGFTTPKVNIKNMTITKSGEVVAKQTKISKYKK